MAQYSLMGSFKVIFEENHGGFMVMSWDVGLNGGFMLVLRAGLRVVPEWSYERQWEAHFSAQVQCFMTLVHL